MTLSQTSSTVAELGMSKTEERHPFITFATLMVKFEMERTIYCSGATIQSIVAPCAFCFSGWRYCAYFSMGLFKSKCSIRYL